ncbi:hypothetical protein [Mucilaginibacter myungsuensis]|uniref:Uncharacterized protein n=1 Tax=Mucilaginibacter myungsuensis TaxID=649104 RepID=A0A929KYY9_9SPHI|nr:hypothetical protein [Mucilaginibacter myungsuensis]MBE9662513.1 hypothetical protein [Mucilaginibacter myungsuensis]MDN3597932.1 hypothetical protein [Mucilaginibacter myungsuensis]
MSMQDKDMDQLFRSQLDNYEIEPSSNVWAGIAAGLDADEHKKSGFPFLRVAASVAILATASYMFWPKGDQHNSADKPKQMATNVKQDVKPVQPQPTIVEEQPEVNQAVKQDQQTKPAVQVQSKQAIAAVKNTAVKQDPTVNNQPNTTVVDPTPAVVANTQPQQILAAVESSKSETTVTQKTTAVVPDDIKLVPAIEQQIGKPAVVVASQSPEKKQKIRGLGGLLNAAIGLVDRREDKIVEFTNNEDGDTIKGINLGIVSFKKEKK